MRVLIAGYYGKGNFGDDILLKIAHSLIRQNLPEADISILLDSSSVDYIASLLGESCRVIRPGNRENFDLIVHGGGGTFFDFGNYCWRDRLINRVLLAAGNQAYVALDRLLRAAIGKPRTSANIRQGWGIGIGAFAPGSPKLRHALPVLTDFDLLWVRDQQSAPNLKRLGVSPRLVQGSDLAFLSEHWCPFGLRKKREQGLQARPAVGVILRDWPVGTGPELARQVRPALTELSRTCDLTVISFDRSTDNGTLEELSEFPMALWDPTRSSLRDFVELLAVQNVFITARAHGAICGACLGVGSVIVDIEPKLGEVHRMLPDATRLWRCCGNEDTLMELVAEVMNISEDVVCSNVSSQRALSDLAWKEARAAIEAGSWQTLNAS